MYRATVAVTVKHGVLDPQGNAIAGALRALGYDGVSGVRVGKLIEVDFPADDEKSARDMVAEMGSRLLANPVLEQFELSSLAVVKGDSQ